MAKKLFKPGELSPNSAQIQEVGPRGGQVSTTESTTIKGKPLPPTSTPGNKWVFVDKTKHQNN